MSLLAAICTATVFAFFGFPFRYYQCWFSFSRTGANAGIAIYLLVAGGGGGLIGWLAAKGAHASPASQEFVNGIVYGIAGALAVRADFGSPRPTISRQLQGAASLLGKGVKWATDLLDEVTRRRAKGWLKGLDEQSLLSVAREVSEEIEGRPATEIPGATKKAMLRKLVEAMRLIRSDGDDQQRADARARLIQFCVEYYVGQHAAKPLVGQR